MALGNNLVLCAKVPFQIPAVLVMVPTTSHRTYAPAHGLMLPKTKQGGVSPTLTILQTSTAPSFTTLLMKRT